MNLILNAIEAMQDSAGELTIKTEPGQGGQLLISVSDTGVGLPDENTDQIFNAFYKSFQNRDPIVSAVSARGCRFEVRTEYP